MNHRNVLPCSAVLAVLLSASAFAQTPADEAAAAQQEMRAKIDAATAADDKFHANRTHANMVARDKAEAEAAAAVQKAHVAAEKARAAEAAEAPPASPH